MSPVAENPATLIESGFASRASTHKSRTSRKSSQKFDSCSLHSLGQLPKRADERNRLVRSLQPKGSLNATSDHRAQHWVAKTRQVRRGPISQPPSGPSGSLSGPSGSPRSPAEPHPPSLAWVETPLPLGPLPPPPGPLDAKHSKRAQGAVFIGTHSPVRSEPSSPPPGSPPCAGGHRNGRGPPVRSRRHTTSSVPLGLSPELCPSPNLRPTSDRRPRSALKAATDHSLPHLPFFLLFEFVLDMADAWPPRRKPAKHTQGNSDNAKKYRVGLGLAGGLGGRAEKAGHSADDELPLEPEPSKTLPPQCDPADTSISRSLLHKGSNRRSECARAIRKTT